MGTDLNPEPRSLHPRCAVLTPPGRGAFATIGVHGPGSAAIVGRRFGTAAGRPLESFPAGRVLFGRFRTLGKTEEELVVGLISEDEMEIHCHGGSAAVEAVLAALVAEGCRAINAKEWLEEREHDPMAADAVLALAHARTQRTAAILLDQYRGALRAGWTALERLLAAGEVEAAKGRLRQLLGRADVGLHLTQPWKVVLTGRPNAGKSSLINALLGYERAIVFPQPGTTRDILTATTALDGWPVELADTAGLLAGGQASDELEAEGMKRARREIAAADAVVFVAETTAPWDKGLYCELAAVARRLIVVHNKCDLAPPPVDGRPRGHAVSAKTGAGVDALCHALAACLVPDPPPSGDAVPFTGQQVAALKQAMDDLARGDLAAARRALGGRSSC